MKIISGCDYCTSTLPTITIQTAGRTTTSICRACILESLQGIEEPGEYPTVIEDRDSDLDAIKKESHETT